MMSRLDMSPSRYHKFAGQLRLNMEYDRDPKGFGGVDGRAD